ncbi:hypothetical protein M5X00_28295 [Paenibacillus alvei]|uniref:Uncharacterized protein n=1 Tax=Paenibacillus alvei TaxID=44250 RepID=A0ABT4H5H1_PAEAL|nr:hypothetical protein [Paenibacillus alvei]MCY9708699.1 hypothetical protein [Paenibacillus alvei]MCY9737284.1 hypothetical protein [Paenibacillus alvei]MCY9758130.1 hypothetical protein [Paenibacillus alvei]MCY9764235.1 hypothetical protein [Paenibacillus alvei]MCY9770906.1 hypothetical protein [Paenibacillus alvei]
MKKRSVGTKTVVNLLGMPLTELVSCSVYLVQVKESAADQWHKVTGRMDKLLTVGHRKRGDVGVLA